MQYPLISVIICWLIVIIIIVIIIAYIINKYQHYKDQHLNYSQQNLNQQSVINQNQDYYHHAHQSNLNVDQEIVKTLFQPSKVLDYDISQLKTSTGYLANDVYYNISQLLKQSRTIYEDLKHNQTTNNPGESLSTSTMFDVMMHKHVVMINIMGWPTEFSLHELASLSINDLEGKINDGFILNVDAFDFKY